MLVNGNRHDFFKSERGLRQGEPISPSFFVISAEFLSQKLNALNNNVEFLGFSMNIRCPSINYLAFADDIILFFSGCRKSLELMMGALSTYEKVSGQMVNKQKSSVSISPKEHYQAITRIEEIIGIVHKSFPIKYLGCPLYIGRKTTTLFSDMMGKILNKIRG